MYSYKQLLSSLAYTFVSASVKDPLKHLGASCKLKQRRAVLEDEMTFGQCLPMYQQPIM